MLLAMILESFWIYYSPDLLHPLLSIILQYLVVLVGESRLKKMALLGTVQTIPGLKIAIIRKTRVQLIFGFLIYARCSV